MPKLYKEINTYIKYLFFKYICTSVRVHVFPNIANESNENLHVQLKLEAHYTFMSVVSFIY